MKTRFTGSLFFFRDVALIVLGATSVSLLLSWIIDYSLSNFIFITSVICWVIAAVPAFSEIGGNASISIRNRKDANKAHELIRDREGGKHRGFVRFDPGSGRGCVL